MDILIEILLEVYMELMFLIIPEDKRGKYRVITKLVAIVATLGIMAMAIWGIVWIVEENKPLGWLPLIIAIALSVIQITLGILLYIRKNKKK